MTAQSVLAPYALFADRTGAPLNAGKIYIGTAGANPITNPIAVWFDADLTIPAAQPIRTSGGLPLNSGAPARLFVDATEYSMVVQTSAGSTVYSSLTSELLAQQQPFGIDVTEAETLAGVTIVDRSRLPGDFVRYGFSTTASASVNATAANAAMLANSFWFCDDPGTYVVNSTLNVQSNQSGRLSQGVTIQADTSMSSTRLFYINEVTNFRLDGGVFDGNKAANPDGTLFGVQILNSHNVRLFGVTSQNFPSDNATNGANGDGFYIGGFAGGDPGSTDVELHGCRGLNNVRQGLSIVRSDGVKVIGGKYSGTTGNNPGAGIDVEANPGLGTASNVSIVGVELSDNNFGLVLTESSFNVSVSSCMITGSRSSSMLVSDVTNATILGNIIQPAMTVSAPIIDFPSSQNVVFSKNVIIGDLASTFEGAAIRFAIGSENISITDNTFMTTKGQAMSLGNSASTGEPTNIEFSRNTLVDCLDPVASPARGPIAIGGNTGTSQFPLWVTIKDNVIRDTRATPADFGVMLTNIPAATLVNYRISGNRVMGPVTPYVDNVSTVPPLCGLVTWNPASLVDGAGETSPNITVLGAAVGDAVEVYPPYALQGFLCTGAVSAADTVVIRVQNETTGTVDLASGSWRVRVRKLFQD
jgi:hypothetical protein